MHNSIQTLCGLTLFAVTAATTLGQVQTPGRNLGVVTVFHGISGSEGELGFYDESRGLALGSPSWAQDFRLLNIDLVGRTQLEQHLPNRSVRSDEFPGATHVSLPAQRGSIYHYVRSQGATPLFGFLYVNGHSIPTRLIELPGVGLLGDEDPFLDFVSAGPQGRSLLVVTRPEGGGDLIEIELRSGAIHNRTQHIAPATFSNAGFWLAGAWGFGVSEDSVLRFERTPGALTESLSFPSPAPTWLSGEAVMSPKLRFAMTAAGSDAQNQFPFVFGRTGPAFRATDLAGELPPAGFQPAHDYGPYMAVSDTGLLAGWCAQVDGPEPSREAFITRTEAGSSSVQVTQDAFFTDTLDEVGQMNFFQPTELGFAVGEFSDGNPFMEKVDVFGVGMDLNANTSFVNRTLTSGDDQVPFDSAGAISAELSMVLAGSGNQLVFDASGKQLLGLRPGDIDPVLVMSDVKDVYSVTLSGNHIFLALRSALGNKEDLAYSTTLDFAPPILLALLGGTSTVEMVMADGHGQVLVHWNDGSGGDLLSRVDLARSEVTDWQTAPSAFSGPTGYTPSRSAIFTEGLEGGAVVSYVWPRRWRQPVQLQAPAGPGFLLP